MVSNVLARSIARRLVGGRKKDCLIKLRSCTGDIQLNSSLSTSAGRQRPEIETHDRLLRETGVSEIKRGPIQDSETTIGFVDKRGELSEYLRTGERRAKGLAEFNRFHVLNKLFGGFRPGEFTIFSGTTGVGKTTFLTEYSLDLASQGVRTLFCSFEMPNAKIMEMIIKQYCQLPLNTPHYNDEIEARLDEVEHRLANLRFFNELHYKKMDEPIVGIDGKILNPVQRVFQVLEQEVRKERIGHLVIDNLQYLMGARDYMMQSARNVDVVGNRFVRQDNFIRSLRSLANERRVHISLVIHPRKEGHGASKTVRLGIDSIYGGGRATQEADNVLIIQKPRNVQRPSDGSWEKKKYLWILKNRHEGDVVEEDRLLMTFNKDTKCHQIIDELDGNDDEEPT